MEALVDKLCIARGDITADIDAVKEQLRNSSEISLKDIAAMLSLFFNIEMRCSDGRDCVQYARFSHIIHEAYFQVPYKERLDGKLGGKTAIRRILELKSEVDDKSEQYRELRDKDKFGYSSMYDNYYGDGHW